MRCVQQKGLLKLWERLCGTDQIPQFSSLPLDDFKRSIDKIMLCDVEHTKDGLRFRIAYHGDQFERMHNSKCVGKYLDGVIAPAVRTQALKSYAEVTIKRQPAFSVSDVRKDDGPIIRYERLLLPFSRKGPFVQRIVCMVTLFSEENGFAFSDISAERLESV